MILTLRDITSYSKYKIAVVKIRQSKINQILISNQETIKFS